jgi:hypothetical protein
MIGKKFLTLTEWTDFLARKYVIVIKESHPHYRKRCKFLEMVGPNNLISHPDNQQGLKIRMKVKIVASGEIIYLKHDEFFVEEGKLLFMPVNGHKFNQ